MRQFANYFENKPVKANLESKIEGICEVINYQGIFLSISSSSRTQDQLFFFNPSNASSYHV